MLQLDKSKSVPNVQEVLIFISLPLGTTMIELQS